MGFYIFDEPVVLMHGNVNVAAAYDVHDGQDVTFHSFAPVMLHHLVVGHHQRLHPLLLADGALADSPASSLLPVLPPLPLPLRVQRALMGVWRQKAETERNSW